MAFLRFVLARRHPSSGVEEGIFRTAYSLRDNPEVISADRDALRDELAWFGEHLNTPERFNRSSSKGHYRRASKGVSWFRDTATEHIARMHHLKRLLEANGHGVTMIVEESVGYVVHEDAYQVVAEPFSETRTGDL